MRACAETGWDANDAGLLVFIADACASSFSTHASEKLRSPSLSRSRSRLQPLGVAREHARLADVVQPAVEHHHALQAHPGPPVRRRPQAERLDVGADRLERHAARGGALFFLLVSFLFGVVVVGVRCL